jgi:hypothetical protein
VGASSGAKSSGYVLNLHQIVRALRQSFSDLVAGWRPESGDEFVAEVGDHATLDHVEMSWELPFPSCFQTMCRTRPRGIMHGVDWMEERK